jgi:hypothetical protein
MHLLSNLFGSESSLFLKLYRVSSWSIEGKDCKIENSIAGTSEGNFVFFFPILLPFFCVVFFLYIIVTNASCFTGETNCVLPKPLYVAQQLK